MKIKFQTMIIAAALTTAAMIIHGPPILKTAEGLTKPFKNDVFMTENEHYIFIIGGSSQKQINEQMKANLPALMYAAKTPVFIATFDPDIRKIARQSNITTEIKFSEKIKKEDFKKEVEEKKFGTPKLMVFESEKNLTKAVNAISDEPFKINAEKIFLVGNSIIAGINASSPQELMIKSEQYFNLSLSMKRKSKAKIFLYWNGIDYSYKKS